MARKSAPQSDENSAKSGEAVTMAHPGKSLWRAELLRLFGKVVLFFRYRIEFEGHGNIPESGPVMILAKHQRLADIPLGLMALVHVRRERTAHIWTVMKDNLVGGVFGSFLLKCGGIPLNRNNPEKSKYQLLFARERLHEGKIVVIFPEQTFYPWKMGRGRPAGFRFVAGKPTEKIAMCCVGFEYTKKTFPRVGVKVRVGPPTHFTADHDPEHFLHDRMEEMADLSNLKYTFKKPEGRRGKAGDDE